MSGKVSQILSGPGGYLLLLMSAAAATLGLQLRESESNTTEVSHLPRIITVAADQQDQTITLNAIGEVQMSHIAQLRAAVSAEVINVQIDPGQMVQKGQLLLELDNRQQSIAVQRAKAQLAEKRSELQQLSREHPHARQLLQQLASQLQLSRQRLKRGQELHSKQLLSLAQLDDHRSALLSANIEYTRQQQLLAGYEDQQAALRQAIEQRLADLAEAERQLALTRIHAAVDGIVSQVSVAAGEYVQSGQSLLQLQAKDELELVVAIPERWAALIQQSNAQLQLTMAGQPLQLSRMTDYLEPEDGQYSAYFKLPANLPATLGERHQLAIKLDLSDWLRLPRQVLQPGGKLFTVNSGQLSQLDSDYLTLDQYLLLPNTRSNRQLQFLSGYLPIAVDGLEVKPLNGHPLVGQNNG